MYKCTIGLPRHRHFVGFFKFNMPVQAPTRDQLFYAYSQKPSLFSRLLQCSWEYGGPILVLTPPPSPHRENDDIVLQLANIAVTMIRCLSAD